MSSSSKNVIACQRRSKLRAVEYLGGKCSICGYNKCLAALHFHHIDPQTKKYSPSHVIGRWSFERVKEELDKCILVCSNCHAEIHFGMYQPAELLRQKLLKLTKQCPICLESFETKNDDQKFCGSKCQGIAQRKIERPSKEELGKMLWEIPTVRIAEIYGITDKAVEKWAKEYELSKPPRGYWAKMIALDGERLPHLALNQTPQGHVGSNPTESTSVNC